MNERNQRIIAEFRAKGGQCLPIPMLLLTTRGARTGRPHTTPMGYLEDGNRFIVFASKGGSPTNPDWYHNLVANQEVTVELGREKFQARAEVLAGPERDRLFAAQVARAPIFGEYQAKTSRLIPVIALSRIDG